MKLTAAYLIGPELAWLLLFVVARIVVALYQPLTGLGHWNVMFLNVFLPAIGVMLAFVPWFWIPGSQGWCLTRTVVASLIGVPGLVHYLSKAASYDDVRDVGLVLGFVAFVFIGLTVLGLMAGVATLFVSASRSFLPVLKWILIVFALFMPGRRSGRFAYHLAIQYWLREGTLAHNQNESIK